MDQIGVTNLNYEVFNRGIKAGKHPILLEKNEID
jgi:hypothetical protein